MYFIFFVVIVCVDSATPMASTLQLVHVLFRHGDRTPDLGTGYPTDPYINETYYPYGPGELTNRGKRREYFLGHNLRERYNQFLGEIYTPDILEAWSSDTNRTKASLQLVLASLFPPVGKQMWQPFVYWQPIPFNFRPTEQDQLFFGILTLNYQKLYADVIKSPRVQEKFQKNFQLFDYISEQSGKEIKSYFDLFLIYMHLKTQEEWGLILPEWTKKVYPQPLKNLCIESYEIGTATTGLKRETSGRLLKKIIDDSNSKINNKLSPPNRKIFLYSGHEINLAHMLRTLEVFKPHIPPYGAYILFELHYINDVYGFKIFYQDYSSSEPQLIKLPACDEFCPFDNFVSLVEEYFPTETTQS